MLVFSPVLIVILPYLVEVERVKEFDCSIKCGHDKADVLDVSELRNRILGRLFCLEILFAGSRCIGTAPFLCLQTHLADLLITHCAYILKLVLQYRVYLRLLALSLVVLCHSILFLRLDIRFC